VYNVSVVNAEGTVESRMVVPSERIGGMRLIDSGLKQGEKVIVEGVQKVRPGMKVEAQVVPAESGETK